MKGLWDILFRYFWETWCQWHHKTIYYLSKVILQLIPWEHVSSLLSNNILMHLKNGEGLDRCLLAREHCDCVCPSCNTLFPGLTQENMGELESVSECVSVGRGWHDFVSEYWTSLLCVLRQERIALSRQGGREGGSRSHNFCEHHIKKVSNFCASL